MSKKINIQEATLNTIISLKDIVSLEQVTSLFLLEAGEAVVIFVKAGKVTEKSTEGLKFAAFNLRDAYLICSKAFYEHITDMEIEVDLSKSKSAKEWLDYMTIRVAARWKSEEGKLSAMALMVV